MEQNNQQNIALVWALWHFYEMPVFLLEVWKNYILFALNYFSLLLLLKSFFNPWHGYRWIYPKGVNVFEFFNTLISNFFSRMLGVMMRAVLIIIGILFQVFVAVAGAIIFLSWMALPFIAALGFLFVLLN